MGRIINLDESTFANESDNLVVDSSAGTKRITKKNLLSGCMKFNDAQDGSDGTFQLRTISSMNDWTNPGHGITNQSTTGLPSDAATKYGSALAFGNRAAWMAQLFVPNGGNYLHFRIYQNGSWSVWRRLAVATD